MSQAGLALLLGVSQQTIAKYETGKIIPPFHVQARIAAILGVGVSEVFGSTPAPAPDEDRRSGEDRRTIDDRRRA